MKNIAGLAKKRQSGGGHQANAVLQQWLSDVIRLEGFFVVNNPLFICLEAGKCDAKTAFKCKKNILKNFPQLFSISSNSSKLGAPGNCFTVAGRLARDEGGRTFAGISRTFSNLCCFLSLNNNLNLIIAKI